MAQLLRKPNLCVVYVRPADDQMAYQPLNTMLYSTTKSETLTFQLRGTQAQERAHSSAPYIVLLLRSIT